MQVAIPITLASGASQTGFGRTGTVDWDTTAKTSAFTGVSGNGYFVNTTSGVITVTLPATPCAGDIVAVADYADTADTNNITLARNGSNIEGEASDFVINQEGVSITLVYVDATKGWITTDTGNSSNASVNPFIIATGGTITCCGNYKIHTFTGPGTFTVSNAGTPAGSDSVDYLVVAGGGAGGSNGSPNIYGSGGGGAGGFRESKATGAPWTASPLASPTSLPVTAQGYPITVGAGGASQATPAFGPPGNTSVFSSITSAGGGGGGSQALSPSPNVGQPGGSGGGGGSSSGPGGTGNTPPTSPPQGTNGGNGAPGSGASGGGGATVAAANAPSCNGSPGGAGATTSISSTPTAYAGGGGGGAYGGAGGSGGTGGGGNGGTSGPLPGAQGTPGTINTGGGGGGNNQHPSPYPITGGGAGGSGIVIIRYKFQ